MCFRKFTFHVNIVRLFLLNINYGTTCSPDILKQQNNRKQIFVFAKSKLLIIGKKIILTSYLKLPFYGILSSNTKGEMPNWYNLWIHVLSIIWIIIICTNNKFLNCINSTIHILFPFNYNFHNEIKSLAP